MNIDQVFELWEGVKEDYSLGLINTERCLQASLYHYTRNNLKDLTPFVEPGLRYVEGRGYSFIPDLVFCEGNRLVGIMEIKFTPHYYPNYEWDIKKLNSLWEDKQDGHQIAINPQTGKWLSEEMFITEETLFMFAVVAQHDAAAVDKQAVCEKLSTGIRSRFILLSGSIGGATSIKFRVTNEF